MEFCIISPTAGLERYATLSKTHLVLSQVEERQYKEFYLKRRREGDLIILDNGAYEGKQSTEGELIDAIEFYNPQVVVLPDRFLRPWEETFQVSHDFLDKYYNRFSDVEWMYVPQSSPNDIMGFIDGLLHAANELPVSWIGIPRCLVTDIAQDPLMRVRVCEFIKRKWYNDPCLRVHALGMYKGNVEELKLLAAAGCDSIDSSAPVWRGWAAGSSLTSPEDQTSWEQFGCDCDFNAELPLSCIIGSGVVRGANQMILRNLEACGVNIHQTR
jgi:hypothetical protein